MALFFDRFPGKYPIALEEIVPTDQTAEATKGRAVYAGLIRALPQLLNGDIRELVESLLRRPRNRAGRGQLAQVDFAQLRDHFVFLMSECHDRFSPFTAYKTINNIAAQIAMMLFVDHNLKQGIGARAHPDNAVTQAELAAYIEALYARANTPIHQHNAAFAAQYFIIQTLFDKIFVGNEEIVTYDEDGKFGCTEHYRHYTAYLELSTARLVSACDAERELGGLLTTGWGRGVDVSTWNELNRDYYGRSDDNFFSADYDDFLDKMLPQFPMGKARAAGDIVGAWSGERTMNLIEIGAGSGSFAVDLFMALRQQGKDLARFEYQGMEPSEAMMGVFPGHFKSRTGRDVPQHWHMYKAGLEEFLDSFKPFLRPGEENVIVFSFSAHHCYGPSLERLLNLPDIQTRTSALYILDGTREHGWTKWAYMPLDCRSPENFDNVSITGSWSSKTLWHEPFQPLSHHSASNAWCALRRLTPPGAKLFRNRRPVFLIDLDGTLYRGAAAIPGGLAFVNMLQANQQPFLLMTNRSERTPKEICAHLAELGYRHIGEDLIYTSAQATADLLKPGGSGVYAVGGPGLHEALKTSGFHIDDQQPDYVVMGLDQTVDYARLARAVDLVLGGAQFVVTNPDRRLSTELGFGPGNGAVAAAVQSATGVEPLVVGKPKEHMFHAALRRLGVEEERVFVIGDNLETDIRGGRDAGLRTILVLTGVSGAQELEQTDVQPDLVVGDLNMLAEILKGA